MGSHRAFTVCDAGYFPGAVALLNSLHLSGNQLPLTVLDVGMTHEQRRLMEPHCEIVKYVGDRHPYLCKLIAPMESDADTIVLIDSDIVVTGLLTDGITAAEGGAVYAFAEPHSVGRWFAEWTGILGLDAPLRRETYVSAGFVAFSKTGVAGLLQRWAALCDDLAAGRVAWNGNSHVRSRADPLWLPEQDVLNALLMSEVPADRVTVGRATGMPMLPDALSETRVVDAARLRCEWRGEPVTMLHAIGARKPWQPSAARELRATAYVRCLLRVLTGPDLVVRIPDDQLVPWLRPQVTALMKRWLLYAYDLPARRSRPFRHRLAARIRNTAR